MKTQLYAKTFCERKSILDQNFHILGICVWEDFFCFLKIILFEMNIFKL